MEKAWELFDERLKNSKKKLFIDCIFRKNFEMVTKKAVHILYPNVNFRRSVLYRFLCPKSSDRRQLRVQG